MPNCQNAEEAITELNESVLFGRKLYVARAHGRNNYAFGSAGSGGRAMMATSWERRARWMR